MNAQDLFEFLVELKNEGTDLSSVVVNYRHNSDSDAERLTFFGEDLFDAETNSRLTSIIMMTETDDY